ncbi:MAG: DUF4363 family protein [Clostridia bacterium]|nr:DUF4363 family protein [Clostridia bacterium]
MKAFIIALVILLVIISFMVVHINIMLNLSEAISEKCELARKYAGAKEWDSAINEIKAIKSHWNKHRTWVALTISTAEIEQIEIALNQSLIYAELHQQSDFMGEFTMFAMLIEHIPHQEGFHIAEIL